MAEKKPENKIAKSPEDKTAKSPEGKTQETPQPKKKQAPPEPADWEIRPTAALTWKTFIIPAVIILFLIGYSFRGIFFKKGEKYFKPDTTIENFILEVGHLPPFRNNKVVVPEPKPDLLKFMSSDDVKWFYENYAKLAFIAVGGQIGAYKNLNDDERKIIAMIMLARDCPKAPVKQYISIKEVSIKVDMIFLTNDNKTFEVRLLKEGLQWKIFNWFGARDRWQSYLTNLKLPETG